MTLVLPTFPIAPPLASNSSSSKVSSGLYSLSSVISMLIDFWVSPGLNVRSPDLSVLYPLVFHLTDVSFSEPKSLTIEIFANPHDSEPI